MCTYFLYIQDKKNVKHEGTDIENEKKKKRSETYTDCR